LTLKVPVRTVPVPTYTGTVWLVVCNVIIVKAATKRFNALTGTPLARLREKSKWLNYLAAMTQSLTVRKSASDTGVHRNTSFRWRHRFLNWITQDRPSTLHGITEADETYLLNRIKASGTLTAKLASGAAKPLNEESLMNRSVCWLLAIVPDKHWISLPATDR